MICKVAQRRKHSQRGSNFQKSRPVGSDCICSLLSQNRQGTFDCFMCNFNEGKPTKSLLNLGQMQSKSDDFLKIINNFSVNFNLGDIKVNISEVN